MRKWYPLVLVALVIAASAVAFPRMPERVPIHWNAHNQIDGFGSRWVPVVLMPMVLVALWGLFRVLPKIDPRFESYTKFQGTYDVIVNAAMTLFVVLHLAILAATLGYPINMGRAAPLGVGLLLVVIGNVLPRARPNWFVGIRTPWTLSNDRVWERTHRIAGRLMVFAGVVAVGTAFAPPEIAAVSLVVLAGGAAAASVIYSYVAWKQETSR